MIALERRHGNASAPRLLPDRLLPLYAYLPGRFPHPVRDPRGHSYVPLSAPALAEADPHAFAWGSDLFNQGYYWEAHEAWEPLWRAALPGGPERHLLHGLILLAAAGVKLREAKPYAAHRHGRRGAAYLRQTAEQVEDERLAAVSLALADIAEDQTRPHTLQDQGDDQMIVFDFIIA